MIGAGDSWSFVSLPDLLEVSKALSWYSVLDTICQCLDTSTLWGTWLLLHVLGSLAGILRATTYNNLRLHQTPCHGSWLAEPPGVTGLMQHTSPAPTVQGSPDRRPASFARGAFGATSAPRSVWTCWRLPRCRFPDGRPASQC